MKTLLILFLLSFSSYTEVSMHVQYRHALSLIQEESEDSKKKATYLLLDLDIRNDQLPTYTKELGRNSSKYQYWWLFSSKPIEVDVKRLEKEIKEFDLYVQTLSKTYDVYINNTEPILQSDTLNITSFDTTKVTQEEPSQVSSTNWTQLLLLAAIFICLVTLIVIAYTFLSSETL